MFIRYPKYLILIFTILSLCACNNTTLPDFPKDHLNIKEPISYQKMQADLKKYSQPEYIELKNIGQSAEGNNIYAIHITKDVQDDPWKVMLVGQQHGDEPAGKDAILYLLKYFSENKQLIPDNLDLWLIPMVNPDGAMADQRRNGNDADLNRDHVLLAQPETRAIHKLFRKVRPHIFVDCHEFGRDSRSYLEKGWWEWPLIMMDCANNPFFEKELYDAGVRWCNSIKPYMLEQGHNYTRYFVGGVPPRQEQRYSTPEIDDARNGLGSYQGLSFIIESGIRSNTLENPDQDLDQRIDAYLDIFRQFLYNDRYRDYDKKLIEKARNADLPDFIPVNYFWGNHGVQITDFKVIDKKSGNTREIKTPNFMHDLIVKKSVDTPDGYVIESQAAGLFKRLLDRQSINYAFLSDNQNYRVEECKLLRIEDEFDPVYSRYDGRQIVNRDSLRTKKFQPGSIVISLKDDVNSRRAALILEPLKLYGLFQYSEFRKLVDENGALPIYRLIR